MNEWLRTVGPAVGNHLWQTTAFVAAVWVATLALRKNQARVRYGLWLAASVKFLVPFALLVAVGGMLPKPQRVVAAPAVYASVDQVAEPFVQMDYTPVAAPVRSWKERVEEQIPVALALVWLGGVLTVLVVWGARWRQVARVVRRADPAKGGREFDLLRQVERAMGLHAGVGLRISQESMEPGMFGMVRPVLVWPERLSERLDDAHIEAILIHELAHARRRDNFTAALHMLVEAAFWFHPLVWWMERRMVEERERACDEAVVAMGSGPGVYADGLLKAVRFCVESPLTCVAGITGADLKDRVVKIMTARVCGRMSLAKKLALAVAALAAVAVPIVLGQAKAAERMMMDAVRVAKAPIRAAAMASVSAPPMGTPMTSAGEPALDAVVAPITEPLPTDHAFEAATIRVTDPNNGRLNFGIRITASGRLQGSAVSLGQLVMDGYVGFAPSTTRPDGGPEWSKSTSYDIVAKLDDADMAGWDRLSDNERQQRMRPMIRRLLADRFHLKLRTETRIVSGYALVQAKGGAKLKEVPPPTLNHDPGKNMEMIRAGKAAPGSTLSGPDGIIANAMPGADLARFVGMQGRKDGPVVDETGLKGYYDFVMKPTGPDPISFLDAVEDQLGLKLVARKVSVTEYIIVSADKPSLDGAEVPATSAAAGPGAAYVPTMTFDVASIREAKIDLEQMHTVGGWFIPWNSSSIRLTNVPIVSLLEIGYGANRSQILGAPDWVLNNNDPIFNIEAKGNAAEDARLATLTKEQVYLEQKHMVHELLAERFNLKAHWETHEGPVLNLVAVKGSKLHAAEGGPPSAEQIKRFGDRPIAPLYQKGDGGLGYDFIGRGCSMADLAGTLGSLMSETVVDTTGLTGKYDFDLKYSQRPEKERTDPATWPLPKDALEDELGLKLQDSKGPTQVLVVDHIDRPSAN
jgi:bla regulator protein BlaR1